MIQLTNVSKIYTTGRGQQVHAVSDVTLDIREGEVFGLIGYSGAGKSTLLRCINLLERPTSGDVVVDGKSLTELSKRQLQLARRKIGMIFQHFHLLHSATVEDNIAFPLRLSAASKASVNARVGELLGLVGLSGYEKKYPAQLSGGQKQRVAIARALANEPSVLLCDEATSALDPQTTRSILDLLLEINRRLQLTVVIVTHEMAVVQRICDRVAVMDAGRIVESGPVSHVFLTPEQEMTRKLLELDAASEIPDGSLTHLHGQLLELTFVGDATYDPVLYRVSESTGAKFSILRGTIDRLKETPFGRLVVGWDGNAETLRRAVVELEANGCTVRPILNAHEDTCESGVEA